MYQQQSFSLTNFFPRKLLKQEKPSKISLNPYESISNIYNYYSTFIAPASYAQIRTALADQISLNPDQPLIAIHNVSFLYRLFLGHTLSSIRLHQSLELTVKKHHSLRTSLVFRKEKNLHMQRTIDFSDDTNNRKLFVFIESTFETDEQLSDIMHDERQNSQLFNLSQGLVFRCHLVYYKYNASNKFLCDKDVIIFNFHHAMFDIPSMDVFLHDLNQAYTTGLLPNNDDAALHYVDCK